MTKKKRADIYIVSNWKFHFFYIFIHMFTDLLNDLIADDSACARKVESEFGFRNWQGWERSCRNHGIPQRIASMCLPKL